MSVWVFMILFFIHIFYILETFSTYIQKSIKEQSQLNKWIPRCHLGSVESHPKIHNAEILFHETQF